MARKLEQRKILIVCDRNSQGALRQMGEFTDRTVGVKTMVVESVKAGDHLANIEYSEYFAVCL